MAFSRFCRPALATVFRSKCFHTGSVLAARQSAGGVVAAAPRARRAVPNLEPLGFEDDALEDQVREGDDAPEPTHRYLQQQREMLYYLRLIEHEMPKLIAYRRPFVPPDSSNPLVIRSISYGGESHAAAAKRTIVVPVARLPLTNEQAIHKFKVLAGVRWTPEPPTDSGLTAEEGGAEHGYFKIACEDFPKGPMNLKWASDTLDRLLAAANDVKETFADVPVDTRHIEARTRKAKKGGHICDRQTRRPTLRDFPKEWLPVAKPQATAGASASA